MGSWGPGLRANDTALDALSMLEKDIKKVVAKKMTVTKLLAKVEEEFGGSCDAAPAVLGVVDELLDYGVKGLGKIETIQQALAHLLSKEELDCWVNRTDRETALQNFAKRLVGKKVNGVALELDNLGLFQRMGASNAELLRHAVANAHDAKKSAKSGGGKKSHR